MNPRRGASRIERWPTDLVAAIDAVEVRFGLRCGGTARHRVEAAVRAAMRELEVDPAELRRRIEAGDDVDPLVDRLVVGESYFFREPQHLRMLTSVIVPATARRRPVAAGPMRLWSAGCAGGEEAYTLAILLEEAGVPCGHEILGTDVSEAAIARARAAVYGKWALRSLAADERSEHFVEERGRFTVREPFRRHVTFARANLLDGPPTKDRFDVVVCRNVLIHLTDDAIGRVAVTLRDSLAEGGWLITGLSDPPLPVDGLVRVRTVDGFAYRRRAPVEPPRATAPTVDAVRRSVALTPPATPARTPRTTPVVTPAISPAVTTADEATASIRRHVETVRRLGDAGLLDEAATAVDHAIEAHPSDPELRYLAATILLAAGCPDDALVAARAAVDAGPRLAATHLLLARIEGQVGHEAEARRSLDRARAFLAELPPLAEVELTGESAAALLSLVGTEYRNGPRP